MSRIWTILKREYLENVRTKAFLIGLILTPVWMGLIFVVPMIKDGPKKQKVVVLDETGELAVPLQQALEKQGETYEVTVENAEGAWEPKDGGESRIDALKRQAGEGALIAVVLTAPVLEKRPAKEGEREPGLYGAATTGATKSARVIGAVLNELVTERILTARNIPKETAALIARDAINFTPLDKGGEKGGMGQIIMPMMMMLLLFMGIVGISQMLINSTLEEKSNRVYEVLLSSVSPFQLMAGKILGICGVGFTLLTLWSGGGLLAASAQGAGDLVSVAQIGWFFVYYLLGFVMIASLMVAIGSACNTIKEAQNLMAPISVVLALPLILSMVIMDNPNGTLATAASFVPPFTPFLMMARIAGAPAPPDWQIWATLLLLVLATYAAVRLAARVFRVGVLMYGQPPTLKQILRWMWAKY